MSRRRRKQNKYDMYGIYEIPNYNKPKKKKKKKKRATLSGVIRLLIIVFSFIFVVYAVLFGVKYTMKKKAVSLYDEGDYQGALDLFGEAVSPSLPLLADFDNDIRLYMADCYINIGEYGLACKEYGKIKLWTADKKKNETFLEDVSKKEDIANGLYLYDEGDYEQALDKLLKAYEDGNTDLVLYVGSCYGQLGEAGKMQQYYDAFMSMHEMNSFMYAQYAAIALDENELDKALEYIEKGKQSDDKMGERELMYDEIVYYEKIKDYNTAFEKSKEFIEAYPNDEDGQNEYNILYTRQTNDAK
ncbi:MAG: hypothetical protein E7271_02715 [Lachnospiraceae bacterium]|nr:hypothetical protein [Lachnospiraceae bacterium]